MANKEIRISHDKIKDPKTITQVNTEEFKKQGLDIHRDGVEELIDDHKSRTRILKVKAPTKFFFQGGSARGKK